jgi:hypothetical protein
MKLRLLFSATALVVLTWQAGTAQVPAGAPSGSTDSATTAPMRTHRAREALVSAIELGATAPTPQAKTTTTASPRTAPGGGRGLVWLNTSTNVYYCYGTRYYGNTKAGKYVSEADAKAAGAHPDQGDACSQ